MEEHFEDPCISIKLDSSSNPNRKDLTILNNPSYEHFFECHLMKNIPCLIQGVGKDWNSTKYWSQNGKPNFDYLKTKYGDSNVPVHNCSEQHFNSHKLTTMNFSEYIDYWKKYSMAKDKTGMDILYLKDWHLRNEYKNDEFYEVPVYFSSDWLNEYSVAKKQDDYRFVYMGPAGSWTPFHKDVMNSFSWSVNICGLKKWLLFPPGQETHFLDKSRQLPHSIKDIPENVEYYMVTQNPGDAIFVPSSWYHQVWNLKDTISINHNWVNGTNIHRMKSCILKGLSEIRKELEHLLNGENDLPEFQDILKCHVGMNSLDFFEFIKFIAMKRIQEYKDLELDETRQKVVEFELKQIQKLLTQSWSIGKDQEEDAEKLRERIEFVLNC